MHRSVPSNRFTIGFFRCDRSCTEQEHSLVQPISSHKIREKTTQCVQSWICDGIHHLLFDNISFFLSVFFFLLQIITYTGTGSKCRKRMRPANKHSHIVYKMHSSIYWQRPHRIGIEHTHAHKEKELSQIIKANERREQHGTTMLYRRCGEHCQVTA